MHEQKFEVPGHLGRAKGTVLNPDLKKKSYHSAVAPITHTRIKDKWTAVNFYWGTLKKKPGSRFILEAWATMETPNEVFEHMFWAEQGRAACVGYSHKQSSHERAVILKGSRRNNQFMCTIT